MSNHREVLTELVAHLPADGEEFAWRERLAWFKSAILVFDLLYGRTEGIELMLIPKTVFARAHKTVANGIGVPSAQK